MTDIRIEPLGGSLGAHIREHPLQVAVEPLQLVGVELSHLEIRANARLKADLVGVVVPDASDCLLVEEEAFER